MRLGSFDLRFSIYALVFLATISLRAQTNVSRIDLPTVLRLANAQNLDVQIAREKLNEAKANYDSAVAQFFPWLSPGISYRRHDNLIQDVSGNIIEVHKQSYAPGATIGAQLELGDAIYNRLVAKQTTKILEHGVEIQRQQSVLTAVEKYFDLLFAQASVTVAEEAIKISSNQEAQMRNAADAGLTYKGDALRIAVQTERNRLALKQAQEQERLAAAQLAETLHLDPSVALVAQDGELSPLTLFDVNSKTGGLIDQALRTRPELKQSQAAINAARDAKKGAVYGPLIPSAGAQFFAGGLGGDSDAGKSRFGDQQDFFVGLSWKIGPGGIFDFSRTRAAESRSKTAELNAAKATDEITRQVVDALTRVQSLNSQIASAKRAMEVAEESLRLTQLRREMAVGIALENILAEQDLTRARFDYLKSIAEFNKAQYALSRAVGNL
jgi:outer membrane protein TolC